MQLLDAYERKTVKLINNDVIIFKVLQSKVIDDNHSCGILGVRSVEITTQSGAVEVSAQQFAEFVVASNYYTKFRDNWDHMRIKKEKLFIYEFGEKKLSQFSIKGTRDELIMMLGTVNPNNKKTVNNLHNKRPPSNGVIY